MPFLAQPLSTDDSDFTPDSESSGRLASPNISSVSNKLHIATQVVLRHCDLCLTRIMVPSALTSSPSGTWILPDHLASWAAVAQEDSGLEAPWTSHEVRSLNSLRKQNQTREACAWRRTGLSEPQARTVLPGIFESSSTPLFLGCP